MSKPKEEVYDSGYMNSISRVFAQNTSLKITLVLMLLVQIGDFLKLNALQENWEAIVIPSHSPSPYKIRMGSASENYLIDMSHYIVNLWGNVTPKSVDEKFEILLGLFHEESYSRYQERLSEIQKEIKSYSTISHIMDLDNPEPIRIVENHLSIKILRSRVVGSTVKPPVPGTLEIDFVIEGGRFKIVELDEKR